MSDGCVHKKRPRVSEAFCPADEAAYIAVALVDKHCIKARIEVHGVDRGGIDHLYI